MNKRLLMDCHPLITQDVTNWRLHKLYRRLIHKACSKIYYDSVGDARKSIMIAGTGRSGTTWLAEIIASQMPCRIMFEPFYSRQVPPFRGFNYFHYMRPMEQNPALSAYCHRVFTGAIRDKWIDRQVDCVFAKHRLIKDIRANLFLKWIQNAFPEVPVVFIIRHPCAVVLSRLQLGWATDTDIDPFLAQPHLIADFLLDKMDVIRRAQTPEEKHAIVWCISNLVPIRQFQSRGLNVVFYENLCLQPEVEIPRIFQAIGRKHQASVFNLLIKPSATSRATSAVVTGHNTVDSWKKQLSTIQIRNILSIVEKFELGYIYDSSFTPLVRTL